MAQSKSIPKKGDDISAWYNAVIEKAKLADHGPVRGTMVIRPYGYAIWENIQKNLDKFIKELGAKNAYFPIFIPNSYLEKEKSHVAGFSPELAVVTHAGGKKLEEPIVVRPTSETIIYSSFAKWIQSFRDLPLIVNQWCNVVRWEKRPYLFLRTTEFLWQEGHTAHKSNEEAQVMVDNALTMYVNFYQNYLGLYGYAGIKSEAEKFAGADQTLTYEMLMPDGKVVQGCTSHNLGQNFAKVFKVEYQDEKGQKQFVHQTSWGFSTRSMGALFLNSGDDNGLMLPPQVAPIQVVIIPITTKSSDQESITELSEKAAGILGSLDIRVKLDNSDNSPGWKFNEYELTGVPLRIEIGSSEAKSKELRVVRRDNKESYNIPLNTLGFEIEQLLKNIQKDLLEKHKAFTLENTHQVETYAQFKEIMKDKKGFVKAYWCKDPQCEDKIKNETKASTRCLPLDSVKGDGECVYCGKKAEFLWLFAQSY